LYISGKCPTKRGNHKSRVEAFGFLLICDIKWFYATPALTAAVFNSWRLAPFRDSTFEKSFIEKVDVPLAFY
jgi:hypothetical protein